MMISEEYEIREGILSWLKAVQEEMRSKSILYVSRIQVECINNLIAELDNAEGLGKLPWEIDDRNDISEVNFKRRPI